MFEFQPIAKHPEWNGGDESICKVQLIMRQAVGNFVQIACQNSEVNPTSLKISFACSIVLP